MPLAVLAVAGDAVIGARMPSATERRHLDIPAGTPVLVVRDATGVRVHRADRVELAPAG